MKAILSVEDVIRQAVSSDAYNDIHPGVIRRVCETESRKGLKSRELVKAIRNRLHQIGGAYLPGDVNPAAFAGELAPLPRGLSSPEIQDFCRRKMENHASTRERLPFVEHFFHDVLAGLPPVTSVIDLACGLTPLAIPWMPLPAGVEYSALDMYSRLAKSLQVFFDHFGFNGKAETADIVSAPFEKQYDVAFILKTLPCLEQQGKGLATALVDRVNAKTLVISYPLRTLGGSRKGLGATYESDFNRLAEGRDWQIARFEFPNELVFRVTHS
ncbi:16S rRNA methyltransferase [Leptolinea sp. HRD-7]|nr:16S rRNA methyltransferase [Leptolinea sp. HRD-7]